MPTKRILTSQQIASRNRTRDGLAEGQSRISGQNQTANVLSLRERRRNKSNNNRNVVAFSISSADSQLPPDRLNRSIISCGSDQRESRTSKVLQKLTKLGPVAPTGYFLQKGTKATKGGWAYGRCRVARSKTPSFPSVRKTFVGTASPPSVTACALA